jgi:hypothetical protein
LTSDLAENGGIPVTLRGVCVALMKNGIHGSAIDQYSSKQLGDVIKAADGRNITK